MIQIVLDVMMFKVVLILLIGIFLTACSGYLTREQIKKGEEMCQNNGGLKTISFEADLRTHNVEVHCQDGLHALVRLEKKK